MGSSASRPETKVFTPAAPVDFSASFLSQLEASAESDYSRAQHTEKYIQERVLAELAKLEAEAGNRFHNAVDGSLLNNDDKEDSKLSVSEADGKITALTKALKENIELAKVHVPEATREAREAVISCLKENSGKPLNCWEEVSQFKKLTKDF